ncbi:MAG: hypothetical protein N3E41_08955 [Thermofilaceae archaeon]|nr:hypothetical protein [Thermofilaceae archaeon]
MDLGVEPLPFNSFPVAVYESRKGKSNADVFILSILSQLLFNLLACDVDFNVRLSILSQLLC